MNPTTLITIEGEHFALSLQDGGRSHTIRIPIAEPDKLVAVLMARKRGALRIAEPGSPTQWNIDKEIGLAQQEGFLADRRDAAFAELGL